MPLILRKFGSGRVEHLAFLHFFLICLSCFLSSFLLFSVSSKAPIPRGEVYLTPYPLLATNSKLSFAIGRPRNLLILMPISVSTFGMILIICWTPKAPNVDPKKNQNGSRNRLPNEAKTNMGNTWKIMTHIQNQGAKTMIIKKARC